MRRDWDSESSSTLVKRSEVKGEAETHSCRDSERRD